MRRKLTTLLAIVLASVAAGAPPPEPPTPGAAMDYGPFLCGSLDRDRADSEKHVEQSTAMLDSTADGTEALLVYEFRTTDGSTDSGPRIAHLGDDKVAVGCAKALP